MTFERRKRKSKWAELYAPDRKPLKAAKNWVMENSTALKNLAEYVTPGEISSTDELEPGQGAIMREGLKKIAAYRDAKGMFTSIPPHARISVAICTGTALRIAGTVRVMARSSDLTDRC